MKVIGVLFLLTLTQAQAVKSSEQPVLNKAEEKLATSNELQMDQMIIGDYYSDIKPNNKRNKLEKRNKKLINKKIKAIQKIQAKEKNGNK